MQLSSVEISNRQRERTTSRDSRELWILGGIVLLGTALRLWRISRLGLDHFDEGVYALSGLWGITSWHNVQLYPRQILFSPLIYVILIGLSYRLFGAASDTAAILVSAVLGAATIVLAWWVARRWFRPAAGIAAAALVALSNYHIAFSRAALTDVTFGFFFLLSLAAIGVALETGNIDSSVLAGLAVGTAWNTKYHGWLPLVIAIPAIGFKLIAGYDRARLRRVATCWLVMAAVAVACYVPWALYIQSKPGGYFMFMKYQRKYLNPHWFRNLIAQTKMQWYLDGWLSRLAPTVAAGLCVVMAGHGRRTDRMLVLIGLVLVLVCGVTLGGTATGLAIAILAVPMLIRSGRYFPALLVCSLGVLFLFTPLYRPYARLLVPFVLIVYVMAGAGLAAFLAEPPREFSSGSKHRKRVIGIASAAVCCLAVAGLFVGVRPTPRTWMLNDSVRQAVQKMAALLPDDSVIFVHGGPEVAFYFRAPGRAVIPIDHMIDHPEVRSAFHLDGRRYFLVTGIYSQVGPEPRASLQRLAPHLRSLGDFPIQPSDVRLLDDFDPRGALQYRVHPARQYDLHFYEIEPATVRQLAR